MRTTWNWLLLPVLAATGCVSLPGTWGPGVRAPAAAKAKDLPPPGPVTADQVNETNAREKAQALSDELDRDTVPDDAAPAVAEPPKPQPKTTKPWPSRML